MGRGHQVLCETRLTTLMSGSHRFPGYSQLFWLPTLGYFLAILSNPEVFPNGATVFDDTKNSMIPRSLMVFKSCKMILWIFHNLKQFDDPKSSLIQREFQLEVWTLIIQKLMLINSSSMVLIMLRDQGVLPWRLSKEQEEGKGNSWKAYITQHCVTICFRWCKVLEWKHLHFYFFHHFQLIKLE